MEIKQPLCARCGEPALGYASIRQERYCHADERSCYSKQLWEDCKPIAANLSGLFIELPR